MLMCWDTLKIFFSFKFHIPKKLHVILLRTAGDDTNIILVAYKFNEVAILLDFILIYRA